MEYTKSVGGAWLDADSLTSGVKIKITSECVRQDSKFKDKEGNTKTENIAKVRVQGADAEVNMRINWASIYALMDAFGTDSKNWVGKVLTAKTLEAMVGDSMRTIVYLIPEGFELAKIDKKMIIRKVGEPTVDVGDEGEDLSDLPF
jgi:hypothetical protein